MNRFMWWLSLKISQYKVLSQIGRALYLHLADDGQPLPGQLSVCPKYGVYLPKDDVYLLLLL